MKLFLHIGCPKTGTSSIQSLLYNNFSYLVGLKYLYPRNHIHFGAGPAHYPIGWMLKNEEKIEDIKNLLNNIAKEAFQYKCHNIILSAENLSIIKPNNKIRFIFIKYFNEISILAYLRRQDLFIEASLSQSAKQQIYKIYTNKIDKNFLNHHFYVIYDKFLNLWKQAFPEAQIIPRVYDRKLFPKGNVILDFLSVVGIDMPEVKEQKIEANPSLSVISTLVLTKINEKFDLSPDNHKKIVKYLTKLDQKEESQIKTFFTLPERIEFLEHFRESNERLFREWFNSENKFVLSEEEIKFYEEQDKIPREEIEKMVEDRYRKVLTYMTEENIKPKSYLGQYYKPDIIYYSSDEVEFTNADIFQVDLIKDKITIGGLVLLKRDVEGEYKLIAKADGEEKEIRWGLPSPGLSKKYPNNPNAKEARFQITNVDFKIDRVEIILNKNKIIEINLNRIN